MIDWDFFKPNSKWLNRSTRMLKINVINQTMHDNLSASQIKKTHYMTLKDTILMQIYSDLTNSDKFSSFRYCEILFLTNAFTNAFQFRNFAQLLV